MRLDDFIEGKTDMEDGGPQKYIRLIKMDTEGSEIDILRSGLGLFEKKQVHSFVVELGVRHWVENKGVSGIAFFFYLWKLIRFFYIYLYMYIYVISYTLSP